MSHYLSDKIVIAKKAPPLRLVFRMVRGWRKAPQSGLSFRR